jgi:hypothetical protein
VLVDVAQHPLGLVIDLGQELAGGDDQVAAGAALRVRVLKHPAGIAAFVQVNMRRHRHK